jgi:hypothetical protein
MSRPVQQTKFRIERVAGDWRDATELVRQASAETNYTGPSVEQMEAVGQAIAAVREALKDWIFAVALKEARPGVPRRDRGVVRAAVRNLSGRD